MPVDAVHAHLEALYAATDGPGRVAHDPVRFAHRYRDPADQELAGLVAVSWAYGSVALFLPVLDRIFDVLDTLGGPARAAGRPVEQVAAALDGVHYRFNHGTDLALLLAAVARGPGVGRAQDLLAGSGDLSARLDHAVLTLRASTVEAARALGLDADGFAALPPGVRYLLPRPADGSGCKRWLLWLRWMVRPPREGVDLGLWTTLDPADLQVPVDVHVSRLSRFLGLTARSDAGWRTSAEITDRLRTYDPVDPVRFDFALAHHGISAACLGHRERSVCAGCVLDPVCLATETGPPAPTSRRARWRARGVGAR